MVPEASAMATTCSRPSHSALDSALGIFRVRQYFNVIVRTRAGREAMLGSLRQFASGGPSGLAGSLAL